MLLAAATAAAVPPPAQAWLLSLAHPPGLPPARLIAPAWALLSLPSGLAAWLAWREPGHRRALLLWGWHLLAFAVWVQCLLTLRLPGAALLAALALALLAGATAIMFGGLRRAAGLLLFPSFAWTCYVIYISAALWWLNRD